jgi:hypothetical protein
MIKQGLTMANGRRWVDDDVEVFFSHIIFDDPHVRANVFK